MERDRSLRSGERQQGATLDQIEENHLWRYYETIKHIQGKRVLDMCCGVGYGSYIMAKAAKEVIGVDDSIEAIEFAIQHYAAANIRYKALDFLDFRPPLHEQIDVLVSFEAIEHIEDTDEVFHIFKAINPELFIVSTPYILMPCEGNKFHYRHYGMDEIVDRFYGIGYKPKRAELIYFGNSLCNFYIGERR